MTPLVPVYSFSRSWESSSFLRSSKN
ncbi:MAG: hypothetical protein QOJ23_1867, partial [Actinomycetota bacterium]|nr:hypothetical protein [Actinomycetota bacterium]